MPELPEVQTIVSDLNKKIINYKIIDFWSDWPRAIGGISLNLFNKEIKGEKIVKIWRLGKNIFIDLTGNKTIYIHLRMTGHLLVKSKVDNNNYFSERVNQYVHHKWDLNGGKSLEFSDKRKFGKIILADTDRIKELKEIKNLGIDLLDKEFALNKLKEILKKRNKMAIGKLLLDQSMLAGIGNIYRSEILFEAKISPFRLSGKLKKKEVELLYKSIIKIIKKAIKFRGTSDSDYRDSEGKAGNFQKFLKVYHREGKKCKICKNKIKRLNINGRSIFYCSHCQK